MPWLNIPEERRTVFIKPPCVRGGGLLGGSSEPPKMSKLQALAAARKKKREEQKSETPQQGTAKSTASEAEILRAKISKLDIHQEETPQNPSPAPPLAPSDSPSGPAPALDGTADSQDHAPAVEKAQPSTFAQALFKSASETPQPQQQLYSPPWLAFTTDEALAEAFSKPSPDDVVQAAQSQGSRFARK